MRIGIDIGGTKIAVSKYDSAMNATFHKRVDTPKAYEAVVKAVADLAREAGTGTIGIGAPGSQGEQGLWRNSNFVACNGKAFQSDLADAIARPIRMENDANCVALAEATDGAGTGFDVVAFYTMGTGLGGGLVVKGQLIKGANHQAGEFGHASLPWMQEEDWPPIACFCGKAGCAEMYVSGTGFTKDYEMKTGLTLTGHDIVTRARSGEEIAKQALLRLQRRFARICGNLVNIIDPDVIVVGGGMNGLPELVEELPEHIAPWSFSGTARVRVRRALHGEASGMRGAAQLWPQ